MYCGNCGKEIPAAAKFCGFCGKKTSQSQANEPITPVPPLPNPQMTLSAPTPAPPAPIRPVNKNRKPLLWVGIGIGAAVLLAGFIFIVFGDELARALGGAATNATTTNATTNAATTNAEREFYANQSALEDLVTTIALSYGVRVSSINISREGVLSIYRNGRYESQGSIVGSGSNAFIRKWPSVKKDWYFSVTSGEVYPLAFPKS
jgi:hypothetical protein